MPKYEVDLNGQKFEIDAPDDQSMTLAVKQLQQQDGSPSQPEFSGGMAGSAALGAADTATFGFGDELGAGLGAASEYLASKIGGPEPRSYDQLLGVMRDQDTRAQQANPYSYLGGQLAGGVGAGLATAGAGLSMSGNAVRAGMASGVRPALGSMVARGAFDGAVAGGLYGAGSGDTGVDRATQVATGAGIGSVAGAAFPLATAGISAGYRNIADRLSANTAARQAGVSPEAMRVIVPTMQADGSLGARGQANMARAGGEAMIADAGPNARAVLDTAIQRGGPGGVAAARAIEERASRGAADLTQALDTSLGVPEGVNAAQRNIRNAARTGVNEAYNGPSGAYAQPIDYASDAGRRVENIIQRIPSRISSKAIAQANERMAYDEIPNMQIMANVADDGSVTFREMPNVMQADYLKKALNSIADDGTDPITRKMSSDGAFASRMANDLRDAVSDAVPEYATALRTAADPLSRQSAVDLGSQLLSPAMTRDRIEEATARYTAPQRDALAQGVRSRIDDIMANVTRTVQDGNVDAREAVKGLKDLSSRANREKLVAALGEDRANPLFDELDRISTSFDLRASVAQNSKTYARQATDEAIKNQTAPGPVRTLASGKPLNAVQRVAQALTGSTPEALQGRQNAIYSEIADFLTRPAAQAIPAFQTMTNLSGRQAANQSNADNIARILTQIQTASYPTTALAANKLRQ